MAISRTTVALSFLVAACGGGGSSNPVVVDSPPEQPAECTAEDSYNATSATSLGASFGCETPGCAVTAADLIFVDAALEGGTSPDLLGIELYKLGIFEAGITTGTFELTGDETNYGTCGACVLIYTDLDTSDGSVVDTYMATGGTLTITSLTPTVTGTISNPTFTHVTIDEDTFESTPVGDCDSTVTGTYSFNETPTELE